MVLCKKVTDDSIYFYTNYGSNKALEIQRIPSVSALFYFKEQGIQVRLKGEVIKMGDVQSDEYWETRPYLSKAGAAVSKQSRKLSFKFLLYIKVLFFIMKHGKHIERPENWGGYIIIPNEAEVFHMGPFRLHSRTLYKLTNNKWEKELLYP
jgi:pyridoxamine 5'-phosphate oxidase